jgi:hypothetical protein
MTQSLYGVFHHVVLELLLLLHHVRRLAPGRQKCLWSDQCSESEFTESGSSIISESGSRVFMTKNWRKKSWFFSSSIFTKKIAIYLSLGLHKGRPNYRRSLQPSKENIRHLKKWNLLSISIFVDHFCPPVSGPWYGSRNAIDSGSNPDPNHWVRDTSLYCCFHT